MSNFYKCSCYGHILEHEFHEDDKTHDLTYWTHGVYGEKVSFRRRAAEAWRVLLGKKLKGFWGVILTDEEAKKLATDILKNS